MLIWRIRIVTMHLRNLIEFALVEALRLLRMGMLTRCMKSSVGTWEFGRDGQPILRYVGQEAAEVYLLPSPPL